ITEERPPIFDPFSSSSLPYPILLILTLTSIFFAWNLVEEQMSRELFATPVALIFLARWLSSVDLSGMLFGSSTYERIRRTHQRSSEGTSPWAVAGFIVFLLVLLQYRPIFRESWLV
ncbi:uncharacterized protein LOC120211282, partial [Hibiscus syriacus]|uniref:uncharacterized protein LOC120211282 n=1 Tax=Hibiscus syriacus TaxID=106335 RepID=UPI00192297B6